MCASGVVSVTSQSGKVSILELNKQHRRNQTTLATPTRSELSRRCAHLFVWSKPHHPKHTQGYDVQYSWCFFKAMAQMIGLGFEVPPVINTSCDSTGASSRSERVGQGVEQKRACGVVACVEQERA